MALTQDRLIQMRVTSEFIQILDDWRREQPDIPNRTETVRRLIAIGLRAMPVKSASRVISPARRNAK
jgi:hypothetical protein